MFLNYFKTGLRLTKLKFFPFDLLLAVLSLFCINIMALGYEWWYAFFPVLAFLSGAIVQSWSVSSPSMGAAFPADHRKKLAYKFLSSLLLYFIFIVIALIIIMLAEFVYFIYEMAEYKRNVFQNFSEDVTDIFKAAGVYGGIFCMAYTIVMYSAGMIISFIKRRKNRNIFLGCFCIGLLLFHFIMWISYENVGYQDSGPKLPFSEYYFGNMNMPWLFAAFCMLFAFAMLGLAIYLGIRHYNPKKF